MGCVDRPETLFSSPKGQKLAPCQYKFDDSWSQLAYRAVKPRNMKPERSLEVRLAYAPAAMERGAQLWDPLFTKSFIRSFLLANPITACLSRRSSGRRSSPPRCLASGKHAGWTLSSNAQPITGLREEEQPAAACGPTDYGPRREEKAEAAVGRPKASDLY